MSPCIHWWATNAGDRTGTTYCRHCGIHRPPVTPLELALKVAADRRWWESYLALAMVLALSLTACGGGEPKPCAQPAPECFLQVDGSWMKLQSGGWASPVRAVTCECAQ